MIILTYFLALSNVDIKMYVYTLFPLQFIVTIVDQACRISRYGSRVGLIEFSESKKTHVEFKFGQLNSKRLVHRGIDRVGYDRGKISVTTVAPTKSDSDVMFCLQRYHELRIDRSLVY